jgi:hypothetical protein
MYIFALQHLALAIAVVTKMRHLTVFIELVLQLVLALIVAQKTQSILVRILVMGNILALKIKVRPPFQKCRTSVRVSSD